MIDQFQRLFTQDALSELGNWASIIGLLIALIGFVVTIWRVLRTHRLIAEIVRRSDTPRLHINIKVAIDLAKDLDRSCRKGEWKEASEVYDKLTSCLHDHSAYLNSQKKNPKTLQSRLLAAQCLSELSRIYGKITGMLYPNDFKKTQTLDPKSLRMLGVVVDNLKILSSELQQKSWEGVFR